MKMTEPGGVWRVGKNTKYYSSSSSAVIEVAGVVEMMVRQQQTLTLTLTLTVAGAPTMSNTNYEFPVVPERND